MEEQNFLIEQLTEFSSEDAVQIQKLVLKIGHNSKPLTDDDIRDMLASPNIFLFVARDTKSHHIVAMVTLLVFRIPYVKKGYLDDLVVDESHRGMGIAKHLMEKAIAFAKEKGASYVDLTARPRRAEGNGLYEKLGFQQRDTNVYRLLIAYAEV